MYIYIYTGWWYTYPSEKYESQLGWLHSHILWKIKKCLKPPTSIISWGFIFNYWGYHWNTRQKKIIRQAEIIIARTAHVGMISLDRAVFSKPTNKGMPPTLMADPRWVPSGKHTKNYGKWQFSSLIYPAIHHHKSCIQLAGSQKETTSAKHCSATDFLKTTQKETALAVPCKMVIFQFAMWQFTRG